jgi:hypothetical protein
MSLHLLDVPLSLGFLFYLKVGDEAFAREEERLRTAVLALS